MNKILLAVFLSVGILSTNSATAADTVNVDVVYLTPEQKGQTLTLVGTVETPNTSSLMPLQPGLVAAINVEKGQFVEQGQTLLVLDKELAELQLAQANASVASAQAAADEAQRLYQEMINLAKQQLVAETTIAERKANVIIAEANLQQAIAEKNMQQTIVARHTLKAPFSGIITERFVNLGEWLTQQTPAFTLTATDNLRLTVAIPQEYFHQLNNGESVAVKVTPDFAAASSISAKLDVLINSAANRSRTLTGLINLPNNNDWLVGMSARAEIALPASNQAIFWVPKAALKRHPDGGTSVFTAVNNKAKQVIVEVIESKSDTVAIKGINKQSPVIVSGVAVLKDGAELSPKNSSGAAL